MKINKCIFTKNDCYNRAPIMPRGIVVHSTGCNNPYLKRYLSPDDGRIGPNKYNNHWNRPKVNKCVHAFIGKDKNGVVSVYQTLPWTNCAWGVGKGKKGSYNYAPTGYIQFEICEDDLKDEKYFKEAFSLAAQFCATLMHDYDIPIERVVSHHEAYLEGYASNHGDCDNWLKKFGKNMAWFRDQVRIYQAEMYDGSGAGLDVIEDIVNECYVSAVKGDSLSKIAKNNGITLKKIKELNPQITGPKYTISVGQRIRVK